MHQLRATMVGLFCLAAATGCTTNTSSVNVTFTKPTIGLAVGTINDSAGVLSLQSGGAGAPGNYLDAVAYFRNSLGNSAFLHPNNATLTPGSGTNNIGDAAGTGVGLFSYGQGPGGGVNGIPAAGPAWAAPGTGTGFLWDLVALDLPALGAPGTSYSLTDTVAVNGSNQTFTAGASLKNPLTILGVGSAAYLATGTTGGGTFTFGAPPAGVTEQIAVVLSGPPPSTVIAMAEAVAPGTTATLPAGTLTPTTVYTCFVIDADFQWVESGAVNAPAVGTPTPPITGASGNSDLSVSSTFPCTG